MKATEFEYRHQTLIHQSIVAVAFLTYFIERDDIVWRFVKDSAMPRVLERALFIVATLLIAIGAGMCTWARAHDGSELRRTRYLGDFLYAIGLGSLAPFSGFVFLVVGEALRLYRLMLREHDQDYSPAGAGAESGDAMWRRAVLREATKWGIFLTMIVFVITLKDRTAEILAVVSFLVGWLCRALFRAADG